MADGGRSRNSRSSIASPQRTLRAEFNSSRCNSSTATDESSRDYTESWVKNNSHSKRPEIEICHQITHLENSIDKAQACAMEARKFIKYYRTDDQYLFEKKNQLKRHLEKIDAAEGSLKHIGPCPIPTCTRHHEQVKDIEMVETGQYSDYPLPISSTLSPTRLTPEMT